MIRRCVVLLLLVVLASVGLPVGPDGIADAAVSPVPFDPTVQLQVEPLYSIGSVATGDLNGDGRSDILARGQQDVVFYQLANGAPSLPVVVDPAPSAVLLRIADISGDGRDDVITTQGDGTLHAKLQKSDGTLAPDVALPPTGPVIRMEVGDYNGDERADIVVVTNTKTIQLLTQKVGGGLSAASTIGTTPEFPRQVVLGDLDGDTKADLAMHWGTNFVYTFQQQGSGALAAPVPVATGAAVGSVVLGRFNGDALVDMVVGRAGTFERVIYRKADLSWSAPAGMGPTAGGGPAIVRTADFNGDGKMDVAVFSGSQGVDLYQQGANGLDPAFQHVEHSSVNYGEIESTAVADLNGDGATDIASVSYEGQVNISSNARTNHAPVVAAASAQTSGTDPVAITASATDADGHALTWSLRTPPAHGTVTRSGATFTYTAASGYTGPDSFQVLADDGHRKYGFGKVGLYVNPFGHITGSVRDGFGPIPGLAVEIFDASGPLATTHTASDGTYRFDEIPQGLLYLWFHDTGNTFVSEWYRNAPSSVAATAISVYPGTTVVADALLMRVGAGGPLKVTTTADGVAGSLRQAIGWANANTAGDTIVLAPGATYTLTCAAGGALLSTDGHLTIEGHGATIEQTCPGERVLTASTSGPTTQGLTISDATLTGGDSDGNGGGILAWGEVTLVDATLRGNHAAGDGGGLWLGTYAAATLVRSRVASNTATSGGGLFMTNVSIDADSVVEGNEALQQGGGIATTSAQIKGTVRDNTATAGGGGISATWAATIGDGATVSGNHAGGDGGGVSAGSVTAGKATLANNVADKRGGAIASTGGVTIGRSTVSGNEAGSSGGGIHGDQVVLELTSVQGNTATVGGGVNAATLDAFAATVSGNSATHGAGFAGGSISLSRSTVHGNNATGSGGAAQLPFRGQLTSRFSTITANTAPTAPAFAWSEQGGITLIGSIVASAGAGPACALAGSTVTDSQYNFVPDTSCGAGAANTVGVDPQLGPFVAAVDGPAVREPLAGSPVIDAIPLTVPRVRERRRRSATPAATTPGRV
jgi:predicted outer membrane repeat protein